MKIVQNFAENDTYKQKERETIKFTIECTYSNNGLMKDDFNQSLFDFFFFTQNFSIICFMELY